ncbi:MAG: LytR/AlgR family response regulator transcription factor [Bacteroidia bacterium]
MRKLTAVAIDDEPLALEVIERFAGKSGDLNLLMAFDNPLEAISFLQDNKVDLIFLDIQMPDLTGIQLLESLIYKPMIVFTTAYSQYAVDSYELGAIDYLLKPVSLDRFLKAVNKAVSFVRAQDALDEKSNEQPDIKDYMFIKSDTRFFKVNLGEILYVEGMRDYVAVHTPERRIMTLMSMSKMMDKLPESDFMRVHKSYIIGLNHIQLIQNNRVKIVEKEIPISNSYKESFLAFVERLNK